MGVKIDLVQDQRKFVTCPSGKRYYFQAGSPLDVQKKDAEYLLSMPEFFAEVEAKKLTKKVGTPATPDKGEEKSPSPPPPPSKKKAEKGEKVATYDLDALNVDKIIEDDMFAKKKKGPWKCPVCGQKGISSKAGVRAHVGSAKCVRQAREKMS